MSMKYFITTPHETEWQVNVTHFVDQLSTHWPSMKINKLSIPESIYLLNWELMSKNQSVGDGSLNKNGQTVTFRGSEEFIAEFALWYRSLVPETEALVLFHESYDGHLLLTSNTTKDEIKGKL